MSILSSSSSQNQSPSLSALERNRQILRKIFASHQSQSEDDLFEIFQETPSLARESFWVLFTAKQRCARIEVLPLMAVLFLKTRQQTQARNLIKLVYECYPDAIRFRISRTVKDRCYKNANALHLALHFWLSEDVILFLLEHYADAAKQRNGADLLPLHIVSLYPEANFTARVIRKLIQAFPEAMLLPEYFGGCSPLDRVFAWTQSSHIYKQVVLNTIIEYFDNPELTVGRTKVIGAYSARALSKQCFIKVLRLDNVYLDSPKAFQEGLQKNDWLRELHLRRKQLGQLDQDVWNDTINILARKVNFRSLTITSCGIGDDYLQPYHLQALQTMTTLQHLSLKDSKLGSGVVKTLVSLIRTTRTLTSLDIRNNWIESEGMVQIASVLAFNTTLTELCIGDDTEQARFQDQRDNKAVPSFLSCLLSIFEQRRNHAITKLVIHDDKTVERLYQSCSVFCRMNASGRGRIRFSNRHDFLSTLIRISQDTPVVFGLLQEVEPSLWAM